MRPRAARARRTMTVLALVVAGSSAPTVHAEEDPEHVLARARLHHRQLMKAGQLAVERGGNPEVRRYGKLLLRDHRVALRRLHQLAAQHGLDPRPVQPREEQMQLHLQMVAQHMRLLRHLREEAFDRTFLDLMETMQATALLRIRASALQTQHEQLRLTLGKLLPLMRQQLELAQELRRRIG